jgi:hypothetical protein
MLIASGSVVPETAHATLGALTLHLGRGAIGEEARGLMIILEKGRN